MTQPSPEFLGLIVLSLVFLSRWLWDYNRQKREEAQQHEPRANPPLHQTFATRVEHKELADKLDTELGRERGARKKMHEEIAGLQSSVAAIRADNATQTRDLADLKQQIGDTNQRIDAVPMRTIQLLRETQQLHQG